MTDHRNEAAIRARAYQLWIEGGYADGSQDANWRQAEREIAEKMRMDDAPSAREGAPSISRAPLPEGGRHVDGISPHPSVLDPAPERSRR